MNYVDSYNILIVFLLSLCDELEKVNPRLAVLNNSQKIDSVSKENLWLKLGKEIYRRKVKLY